MLHFSVQKKVRKILSNSGEAFFDIEKIEYDVSQDIINLLSGQQVTIDKTNYRAFSQLFKFIQNPEFKEQVGSVPPTKKTLFSLTFKSLEGIKFDYLENSTFTLPYLDISLPIGLCNLFFSNKILPIQYLHRHQISSHHVKKYSNALNSLFHGQIIHISKKISSFFKSLYIHSNLIQLFENYSNEENLQTFSFPEKPINQANPVANKSFSTQQPLSPALDLTNPKAKFNSLPS